jgi:hypothetical protein
MVISSKKSGRKSSLLPAINHSTPSIAFRFPCPGGEPREPNKTLRTNGWVEFSQLSLLIGRTSLPSFIVHTWPTHDKFQNVLLFAIQDIYADERHVADANDFGNNNLSSQGVLPHRFTGLRSGLSDARNPDLAAGILCWILSRFVPHRETNRRWSQVTPAAGIFAATNSATVNIVRWN